MLGVNLIHVTHSVKRGHIGDALSLNSQINKNSEDGRKWLCNVCKYH